MSDNDNKDTWTLEQRLERARANLRRAKKDRATHKIISFKVLVADLERQLSTRQDK